MISLMNFYVLIVLFSVIIFLQHVRKRSRHPPGPLGVPYLGFLPFQAFQILFASYLPKISQKTYFKMMREKYGDFWSMEMGSQRIVTLASFNCLSEAFFKNGNVFCGKPANEVFEMISEGQGILLIDGELWRENREMTIKAFQELGIGQGSFEGYISKEANMLIEHLTSISNTPITSSIEFIKAESNVISQLLFNECNDYDDPEFEVFLQNLKCAYQSEVIDTKCTFFPSFLRMKFVRHLFSDVDRYFKAWSDIRNFVGKKCQKRKLAQSELGKPMCVFDYFWLNLCQDEPETNYEAKMYAISHSMKDLYMAGTDTANTLLGFSCLLLGRYPEIQNDLRSELENVIDDYTKINMSLKNNCPKLLSFMDEIQRFCCLLPKFHGRVNKKFKFKGYQLHPDDIILGDWGTISRDKALFEHPDVFDPYRFMDRSKTNYVMNKYVIPFGIGKRACIGEVIANMEFFLFLSRIILAFNISLPFETRKRFDVILEGRMGLIHAPLEHTIKLDLLKDSQI